MCSTSLSLVYAQLPGKATGTLHSLHLLGLARYIAAYEFTWLAVDAGLAAYPGLLVGEDRVEHLGVEEWVREFDFSATVAGGAIHIL